jgi:hypothetical protein
MKQKGTERDDREGLLKVVGKKGEAYSLEMQELGMELTGRGLPAPEARAVLIIFMKASYPEAKVGVDYRIPDPMMFKRWRTYLEPLGQFMALRAVDRAKIIHVLHDATSKKGVSFFSVVAKVTVDGKTQSIPLSFKVPPPPTSPPPLSLSACVLHAMCHLPSSSPHNFLSRRSPGMAAPLANHAQWSNLLNRTSPS